MSKPLLVRQEWIAACHFHDLTEAEVLAEVARRAQSVENSLVLLDLDGTLYDVAPRTLHILKQWRDSDAARAYPRVREALGSLDLSHIGYSLNDAFLALGLDRDDPQLRPAFEDAKKFWGRRFFTSEYLPHDLPYAGAAKFAQQIHELGAEIIYLTGRDEPGMGEGTRANLIRDGFPWEKERTFLMCKRDASFDDLLHKKQAAAHIRERGNLIASFENEPKNLVALAELFPDAMHVFVETFCSDHEAMPCRGIYRIKGFEG